MFFSSELFQRKGVHVYDVHVCVRVCNLQLCVLSCSVVQFLHSKHMFTFFSPEGQWTLSVPTAVISPDNEPA